MDEVPIALEESAADRRRLRGLGVLVIALALLGAVVVVYAAHLAMQFNPLLLPHESQARGGLTLVMPQGWRFFTRNPQEGDIFPLAHDEHGWRSVTRQPNARAVNLFGINRAGRAQGIEMGLVASGLAPAAWVECKGDPIGCLDPLQPFPVLNATPSPSLCGDIGLVKQEPVPWAWARSRKTIQMPSRVARVMVQCSSR